MPYRCCMAAAMAIVPGRLLMRDLSRRPSSLSLYTYSLWWVVMLMYEGLNSFNLSMVLKRAFVPLPLRGGRTSNEKCLLLLSLLNMLVMLLLMVACLIE